MTLNYINIYEQSIEAEFNFPILPNQCFDKFEAEFNGKKISGVIKERQKANEEYKANIEAGNCVSIAQIYNLNEDIININIGIIPPNSKVLITFGFAQELELVMNKFWKFKLPRYCSEIKGSNIYSKNHKTYTWEVTVDILCTSNIQDIRSYTQNIQISELDKNNFFITFSKEEKPN